MAEAGAQEKTEPATPRRRQEARKKGTVARSPDLTSSLAILALLVAFPTALTLMGRGFIQGFSGSLAAMPKSLDFASIGRFTASALQPCLPGFAILIFTAMIVGVVATTGQVGFLISAEALNPSFAKLNPISGFKRLFSGAALFEAIKALSKSLLFGLLSYGAISAAWPKLIGLGWVTPEAALGETADLARGMAVRVVFAWLALATLDYWFQRKRIDKQLRMSKEEIKQEMRQMEQSPELKAEMSRKRRRMAKGRMMDALRKADVVITNPTHYAVALQYDVSKSIAPIVVAKGADFLAAKIREVAGEHSIPIIPNPPLARALYRQCEIGDVVPKELFQPVAEVLAYVYQTFKDVRKAK